MRTLDLILYIVAVVLFAVAALVPIPTDLRLRLSALGWAVVVLVPLITLARN